MARTKLASSAKSHDRKLSGKAPINKIGIANKFVGNSKPITQNQEKKPKQFTRKVKTKQKLVRAAKVEKACYQYNLFNQKARVRQIRWSIARIFEDNFTGIKFSGIRLTKNAADLIHVAAVQVCKQIMLDVGQNLKTTNFHTITGQKLQDACQIWSKYNDTGLYSQTLSFLQELEGKVEK